jgi:serine phosphatase RsbU (regulator of sigma subunit)
MRLIHIPISFPILGFDVSLGTLATVVSLLLITVMVLIRFFQAQRLKEQWKLEIQQAQHVQQILIPNQLSKIHGLTIESEYRPAREVGGDFFQVIPGELPGSVLILVGDVTGKGTQAGMLVALIVGAVRAAAQHSSDPEQILHEINVQLCERQHASATCLMLRIDPDGSVLIANAGQLPPYLNGREIEMEGALPLGTIPDADHSITRLTLQPGDSLIVMSDGIVEAQNPRGDLFGFDRINELLEENSSAEEIANAAQAFGQEDDILVLQVRRNTA